MAYAARVAARAFHQSGLVLLLLVRVALHFLRSLGVLGQHLRWSEFEIHLADRAGEGEWHLVVGVVHRCARVGAAIITSPRAGT